MVLKTYRSDYPVEVLVPIWERSMMGLTLEQIQHGFDAALKEYKGLVLMPPAMVRAWAAGSTGPRAEECRSRPGSQQGIEWYIAENQYGGQIIAWHAGLKDKDGNPVLQDPNLTWIKCRGTRGVPVQQLLDPCPECHKGKGTPNNGAMAAKAANGLGIAASHLPAGQTSITCDACGWSTGQRTKMREAISEWNR